MRRKKLKIREFVVAANCYAMSNIGVSRILLANGIAVSDSLLNEVLREIREEKWHARHKETQSKTNSLRPSL